MCIDLELCSSDGIKILKIAWFYSEKTEIDYINCKYYLGTLGGLESFFSCLLSLMLSLTAVRFKNFLKLSPFLLLSIIVRNAIYLILSNYFFNF